MADLEPAWEFKTDDNVWAACLSRDGKLLVIGSWDSSAYAIDRTGNLLWKHKTSDYVKGIGISDDGELTVIGSYDRYIYAIKSSGKLAWRYKTENYVRAVGVSADGEYVAAGSWRGTVYYLDKRGKLLWKQRIGSPVINLSVSGDGGLVVAGCEDGSVHAYSSAGEEMWTYRCGGVVTNVAVSKGGKRIAVASKDTLLTYLDAKGGQLWKFHLGGSTKGMSFIQGDEIVVVFTDNNFLQYVDASGNLMFMRRIPEEIWEGAVASDGISVAVATKDNRSIFFENRDLAAVVLETTQVSLEKVITDNIDITKAQEMHRHAGELLADGKHGEAIHLALEARAISLQMHSTHLGDRAKNLLAEVDGLITDNPGLDMRKAIRYMEKAHRGLDEGKMERVIFYGEQARAAALESIEKETPAVEDELFAASLGGPIDIDDTEVDRLLGMEVPEVATTPQETEPGLADELAEEIGDTVAEMGSKGTAEGGVEEGFEAPPEEPPSGTGDEGQEPPSDEVEEDATAEDEVLASLGAPPDESPVDLYTDTPGDTTDDGMHDVCPNCGEPIEEDEDGRCKSCVSDEVMKFAVDNAKQAHKEGRDISVLAPDLKAVKAARQEKGFEEVIAISERIVMNLEDILGQDLRPELDGIKAGRRQTKKSK